LIEAQIRIPDCLFSRVVAGDEDTVA
jgi:hypothetical protein